MNRENTINTFVVAIAGASGSGKSRLAANLKAMLDAELFGSGLCTVSILSEDAYYGRQDDLSFRQRQQTNYDHPDAIDQDLLCQQLELLKQKQSVDVPVYDYQTHNRSAETRTMGPSDILIVEGILLLSRSQLRPLFDLAVFVDVEIGVCLQRRVQRDVVERGRSEQSVREQFAATVEPMFREFVLPSKAHADIVVPRGGENAKAVAVLGNHLLRTRSTFASD